MSSVLRGAELTHLDHAMKVMKGEHWGTVDIDRLHASLEYNPIDYPTA